LRRSLAEPKAVVVVDWRRRRRRDARRFLPLLLRVREVLEYLVVSRIPFSGNGTAENTSGACSRRRRRRLPLPLR